MNVRLLLSLLFTLSCSCCSPRAKSNQSSTEEISQGAAVEDALKSARTYLHVNGQSLLDGCELRSLYVNMELAVRDLPVSSVYLKRKPFCPITGSRGACADRSVYKISNPVEMQLDPERIWPQIEQDFANIHNDRQLLGWGFHVASPVVIDEQIFIADPGFSTKALELNDWLDKLLWPQIKENLKIVDIQKEFEIKYEIGYKVSGIYTPTIEQPSLAVKDKFELENIYQVCRELADRYTHSRDVRDEAKKPALLIENTLKLVKALDQRGLIKYENSFGKHDNCSLALLDWWNSKS